ncbi:MAG TPA: hypothetical protein VNA14_03895 [Mycobacteriales bacterium]|nr:hypothetical protein [Mycobacteriales bacterium]
MNVRRAAVIAAVVAAGAGMLPASAAPKAESVTYSVTAPVPFPVTNATPPLDGCWNGEETLTKNTRPLSFKVAGTLSAQVAYFGDWDLLLFDAKGAKAAAAETTDGGTPATANKEKIVFKKMKPGARYTLVVCNWLGQKDATVTYTFTPAK